jgi:hypothetical protein
MLLNERILELENKIIELEAKIQDLSRNTEEKYSKPFSIVGGVASRSLLKPTDIRAGRGLMSGNQIIWNNTEIDTVYGIQPVQPEIGYNKHGHSRFSGGALIKGVIEVVEYEWDTITNKHSQGFLKPSDFPKIAKDNTSGINPKQVEKIGLLDLVFNADTKTWGCSAYEIDVKKCYLVEKDKNGIIALDKKGQEKKSLLYNIDDNKTSVVWDENAGVWRFLAVYASGE